MTWCTDYLGSRLPRITCEASRLDAEGGRVEEATQFGLDDFGPAKKSSSWPDVHRLPCFNLQQINVKKCLFSIRCWDWNSRPLENQSSPVTTIPAFQFVLIFGLFLSPSLSTPIPLWRPSSTATST